MHDAPRDRFELHPDLDRLLPAAEAAESADIGELDAAQRDLLARYPDHANLADALGFEPGEPESLNLLIEWLNEHNLFLAPDAGQGPATLWFYADNDAHYCISLHLTSALGHYLRIHTGWDKIRYLTLGDEPPMPSTAEQSLHALRVIISDANQLLDAHDQYLDGHIAAEAA